jgi:hypothetical protein
MPEYKLSCVDPGSMDEMAVLRTATDVISKYYPHAWMGIWSNRWQGPIANFSRADLVTPEIRRDLYDNGVKMEL